MAGYDEIVENVQKTRDMEYGYETEEEKKGKNFLDFIIDYIKTSKEAKKPKLEAIT
jgi:hypothetical protein